MNIILVIDVSLFILKFDKLSLCQSGPMNSKIILLLMSLLNPFTFIWHFGNKFQIFSDVNVFVAVLSSFIMNFLRRDA